MTAAAPKRYVVRLRWERSAYTSSVMPQDRAEAKAAELEEQIIACGDGPGFVELTRFDGGTIRMRAREVIGIEAVPHLDREEIPSRALGVRVDSIHVNGDDVQAAGTQFLRALATQERTLR